MAIPITIPRLGWSMEEGTFAEWLKEEGDHVRMGDPIYVIESEKALQEVESVDEGILQILADGPVAGDEVTVGTLIGYLLAEGESPLSPSTAASSPDEQQEAVEETPSRQPATGGTAKVAPTAPETFRISPRAARLAVELGVDPSAVAGSGRNGRIRESDIRAAAAQSAEAPAAPSPVETSRMRTTIARRMMHSVQNTAPVTLTTQADAECLVRLRRQFVDSESGAQPTYVDMLIKLTSLALQEHPVLNSRWTDSGIEQLREIHMGIAIDTDDGLLVPVVRHVGEAGLDEIAARTADLIDRAHRRQCTSEELTGGTFTVTNLGSFGIDAFTPIINWPESAVLGVGAIRRVPVVLEDDSIASRHRLTLSLTFDHRVTDGAPAARFLRSLCSMIEEPAPHLS